MVRLRKSQDAEGIAAGCQGNEWDAGGLREAGCCLWFGVEPRLVGSDSDAMEGR